MLKAAPAATVPTNSPAVTGYSAPYEFSPTYTIPPTVVSPTTTVPQAAPSVPVFTTPPPLLVPAPTTSYKPIVPLGQQPTQYYLGRGLLGQPKLYVPDQPVRNFLRYLSL